jgi:hypothetical protein
MKKLTVLLIAFFLMGVLPVHAATWYVDNAARGTNNGTSWANAWISFSNIIWGTTGVKAGDKIYISGGSSSKTYNEGLTVRASGSDGYPITITIGRDIGHNGQVVITNSSGAGITISSRSYINIIGSYDYEQRMRITGCYNQGVIIGGAAHHNILKYLEVDNNGHSGGVNQDGISTSYSAMTDYPLLEVAYCKVHNNWQDQMHIVGHRGPEVYGRVLIHHNEIYELQDDGIESGIRGMDIYDNVMHTLTGGKGTGHPDGIVTMAGYARVTGNVVYDLQHYGSTYTNAYIYPNIYSGTATSECCIRVLNNIVFQNLAGRRGDYGRGIEFSCQGYITSVSDLIIANNTVVGMPAWGINLFPNNATISGVQVLNNVVHNCYKMGGGQALNIGKGSFTVGSYNSGADMVIDYNNVSPGTQGTTTVGFKGTIYRYAAWKSLSNAQANVSGNNDPLLDTNFKPTANSCTNRKGVNLSTYFTRDKNGSLRPAAWTMGAYEYFSGTKLPVKSATGSY